MTARPAALGGVLDAAGDVGEERVGDVEHDEPDRTAAARRAAAGPTRCGRTRARRSPAETRSRVSGATRSGRLSTLDTVPTETPARAATSLTLTVRPPVHLPAHRNVSGRIGDRCLGSVTAQETVDMHGVAAPASRRASRSKRFIASASQRSPDDSNEASVRDVTGDHRRPRPLLALDQAAKSVRCGSGPRATARVTLYPGEAHALLGENGAGKSTLVKILAGVHRPDAGQLLLDGEPVEFDGPPARAPPGVAVIYQEPTLFPDLSVAENIFMGRQPLRPRPAHRPRPRCARRPASCSHGSACRSTRTVRRAGCRSPTSRSSRSPRRSSFNARVIVMDEPTAALTRVEVDRLFDVSATLRARGRGGAVHLAPARGGLRPAASG